MGPIQEIPETFQDHSSDPFDAITSHHILSTTCFPCMHPKEDASPCSFFASLNALHISVSTFTHVPLAFHSSLPGETLCLCCAYGFHVIITCICLKVLFFAISAICLLFGRHPLDLSLRCLFRIEISRAPLSLIPLASPTSPRPCAPSSHLFHCALLASSQHPPSPLGEDQSAIHEFTCKICWTASCSPRLMLWFSQVPASESLPTSKQALTGFNQVSKYINSRQSMSLLGGHNSSSLQACLTAAMAPHLGFIDRSLW
ncbi:uncharacterized protein LACBIDRAFT_302242 [Laccaria bicolor S238N-H82]|uniref:Predicted protein n=1 Tax=Laccaria bicolor (strain S238N-H82 / ATCC MYA-4686) TaxID=486041 RepID=B0DHD7_LACBS|nr:uncharacterized protein LACBIDRAFT_302242 [Laccaria bicolor S238N-H82]EDR06090.1 predicted protein [Laccaria bicolor S238N-H82]|eukprot:XP_001883378.1 predicted protein [Laccaria bicolor S238N-H82]